LKTNTESIITITIASLLGFAFIVTPAYDKELTAAYGKRKERGYCIELPNGDLNCGTQTKQECKDSIQVEGLKCKN
jgi:hypothetical protein